MLTLDNLDCLPLKEYVDYLKTEAPWVLTQPEALTSGALSFFLTFGVAWLNWDTICLIYPTKEERWRAMIDRSLALTTLYIVVDFLLDQPQEAAKKETLIKQMKALAMTLVLGAKIGNLTKPENLNPKDYDPMIVIAYGQLYKICQWSPKSVPDIIKCMMAEFESVKVQSDPKATREELHNNTLKKGATTIKMFISVLTGGIMLPQAETLGHIMQLLDDISDVYIDLDEKNNTSSTHDFLNKGCIDSIIFELFEKVDSLDNRYSVFKPIFYHVVANIMVGSSAISKDLCEIARPYSPTFYRGPDPYSVPIFQYATKQIIKKLL